MTAEFNREQCDIIRAHSPERWITHNFMVNETSFDHWNLGSDLAIWRVGIVIRSGFLNSLARVLALLMKALLSAICVSVIQILSHSNMIYTVVLDVAAFG